MRRFLISAQIMFSMDAVAKDEVKFNTAQSTAELNIPAQLKGLVIDPHRLETAYSMMITLQVHRGLFRYSPDGNVLEDAVESWEKNKSNTKFLFKLKKISFSDGTPLKATHVKNSFARIFLLGGAASMGADMAYIEGSSELQENLNLDKFGVNAIDDHTVEFSLSRPSILFIKHLAAVDCGILAISNKAELLESTKNLKNFPGIGPFKVSKQTPSEIVLEKWKSDPLDSKNPPQRIRFFEPTQDPVVMAKAKLNDVLDHESIDDESKALLLSQGWFETATELSNEIFVVLNPKKVARTIREYVFNQLDVEKVLKEIDSKMLKPAYGLIPNGIPGFISKIERNSESKLFDTQNKSIPKGSFELEYADNSTLMKKIAFAIKKQLDRDTFAGRGGGCLDSHSPDSPARV